MNSSQSLALKYTPVFPVLLLISSLITLWATTLTGVTANTVLAILLLLLSILMFTRPILVITATRAEQRNLIGRVVKSYSFSTHPPAIRGNAFYCGGTKLCPQWMINTKLSSIEQFLKALGTRIG